MSAFTVPGSYVVFVCSDGFRNNCANPLDARTTVVHELLHTLGLGENPPSGYQISMKVMERCGQ